MAYLTAHSINRTATASYTAYLNSLPLILPVQTSSNPTNRTSTVQSDPKLTLQIIHELKTNMIITVIHCMPLSITVITLLQVALPFITPICLLRCQHLLSCIPAVDCGDPGSPTNGQRSVSSTTYNSVVTYTCDVGYTLQGSNSRTCQSSGLWNGSVPQCNRT